MSRLHGSRAESATRPPPRFQSCSAGIMVYRPADTGPRTPNGAEAKNHRGSSSAAGHRLVRRDEARSVFLFSAEYCATRCTSPNPSRV